jgi:hypothetical protein
MSQGRKSLDHAGLVDGAWRGSTRYAVRPDASSARRGLEKLIQVKRDAGRPKDLEAIAELEALLEERRGKS